MLHIFVRAGELVRQVQIKTIRFIWPETKFADNFFAYDFFINNVTFYPLVAIIILQIFALKKIYKHTDKNAILHLQGTFVLNISLIFLIYIL